MKFETIRYYLFKECLNYLIHLLRHNASVSTSDSKEKMQFTLLRETHVVEKGLSYRTPKLAFGKPRILSLISNLEHYAKSFGDPSDDFLRYPLSVIQHYITHESSRGADVSDVSSAFESLCKMYSGELSSEAGIRTATAEEVLAGSRGNFAELMASRHSIRYFSRDLVSDDVLCEALRISQLTPSACNRQAWYAHVFRGDKVGALLRWQCGARGFEDEPTAAILVTAKSNGFLKYEPFQAYVDGGLYAMNLINALHSLGLGTIPLSCGFGHSKIIDLRKSFDVPDDQVPILIVGIGHLEKQFSVAVSKRKDLSETTTWH